MKKIFLIYTIMLFLYNCDNNTVTDQSTTQCIEFIGFDEDTINNYTYNLTSLHSNLYRSSDLFLIILVFRISNFDFDFWSMVLWSIIFNPTKITMRREMMKLQNLFS